MLPRISLLIPRVATRCCYPNNHFQQHGTKSIARSRILLYSFLAHDVPFDQQHMHYHRYHPPWNDSIPAPNALPDKSVVRLLRYVGGDHYRLERWFIVTSSCAQYVHIDFSASDFVFCLQGSHACPFRDRRDPSPGAPPGAPPTFESLRSRLIGIFESCELGIC